jgi:hypothetical protein
MGGGGAQYAPTDCFVLRQAQEAGVGEAIASDGEDVEANKQDQAHVAAGCAEIPEQAAGDSRVTDEQGSAERQRNSDPAGVRPVDHKLLNTLSNNPFNVSISLALMSLNTA